MAVPGTTTNDQHFATKNRFCADYFHKTAQLVFVTVFTVLNIFASLTVMIN